MRKHLNMSGLLLILVLLITACSGNGTGKTAGENTASGPAKEIVYDKETGLLFDYLAETGDYVNSRDFPSLINADALYESLGENTLVIDLRDSDTYREGHIEGAVNVSFSDIPDYFENEIKAYQYDKIVMCCYSGQMSSYTTALLRLMGYGNVYSLRWGMSVWNHDIYNNNPWIDHVSSDFTDKLEQSENAKPEAGSFPGLATGLETGEEILNARIRQLFAEGFDDVWTNTEEATNDSADYFIINYDRKDKYESGHLPGAVRYKPNGMLGIPDEMITIPAEQDVAVYCGTGHSSAFVTAYLRLFGYNAHSITYGNNRFMHDKMLEEENTLSWPVFTEDLVNDFPYVKE